MVSRDPESCRYPADTIQYVSVVRTASCRYSTWCDRTFVFGSFAHLHRPLPPRLPQPRPHLGSPFQDLQKVAFQGWRSSIRLFGKKQFPACRTPSASSPNLILPNLGTPPDKPQPTANMVGCGDESTTFAQAGVLALTRSIHLTNRQLARHT